MESGQDGRSYGPGASQAMPRETIFNLDSSSPLTNRFLFTVKRLKIIGLLTIGKRRKQKIGRTLGCIFQSFSSMKPRTWSKSYGFMALTSSLTYSDHSLFIMS